MCSAHPRLVAARLVRVRRAPPMLQLARLVAAPDLDAAVEGARGAGLGRLVCAAVGARVDLLHPLGFLAAALAATSATVRPVRVRRVRPVRQLAHVIAVPVVVRRHAVRADFGGGGGAAVRARVPAFQQRNCVVIAMRGAGLDVLPGERNVLRVAALPSYVGPPTPY